MLVTHKLAEILDSTDRVVVILLMTTPVKPDGLMRFCAEDELFLSAASCG